MKQSTLNMIDIRTEEGDLPIDVEYTYNPVTKLRTLYVNVNGMTVLRIVGPAIINIVEG